MAFQAGDTITLRRAYPNLGVKEPGRAPYHEPLSIGMTFVVTEDGPPLDAMRRRVRVDFAREHFAREEAGGPPAKPRSLPGGAQAKEPSEHAPAEAARTTTTRRARKGPAQT